MKRALLSTARDSPPVWLRGSPSSSSPIPYVNTDSDSDSDEEETDFILQGPPSVRGNLEGPRTLVFTDSDEEYGYPSRSQELATRAQVIRGVKRKALIVITS